MSPNNNTPNPQITFPQSFIDFLSVQPYTVVIICTKSSIAFWALPLSRLITCLDALIAKYVKTFCQYHILSSLFTTWAR